VTAAQPRSHTQTCVRTPWHVHEVARAQLHVQNRLAKFVLIKVRAGEARQDSPLAERRIQAPPAAACAPYAACAGPASFQAST